MNRGLSSLRLRTTWAFKWSRRVSTAAKRIRACSVIRDFVAFTVTGPFASAAATNASNTARNAARPSKCRSSGTTWHECGMLRVRNVWPQVGQRHIARVILTGMRVIVDNSAGGDAGLADAVVAGLRDRGLDVDLVTPGPTAMFDTAVHLVSLGLAIRVSERPDRATLAAIEDVVRAALIQRPSLRRRTRSVPVHLGDTARVLEWIDVFD